MPLSDAKIRNAKPQSKPYKLADSEGMYLLVHPNGGKYWRLKYRFAGRERILALGVYPEVDLSLARERRLAARKALADGRDPGDVKREAKRQTLLRGKNTFETVALDWYEHNKHRWTTRYSETMMFRLKRHIFPALGHRPAADIKAPELLTALRVVEKSGALDLAKRLLQVCGQIFSYAIVTGRAERNPVPDLRGTLKVPVKTHYAYLKAADLPAYLKKLAVYDGGLQTRLALRLLLLTFVRTVELRGAQWPEIDFDNAEWRIPAERMKMRELHIVPLSRQAVAVLREMEKLTGGKQTKNPVDEPHYIFPNQNKPNTYISENTMLYALYRMGYHSRATGHGFRSTASTILNENGFAPDVIERQLAHDERNKVRAAYNHAQYLPERRKMMQWWADYLDEAAQKPVPANN
jgi:integrase